MYLYNPVSGQFTPIKHGLTCGRTECDLSFSRDVQLSRRHCRFSLRGEDVYIQDMDSTNGTRVNSEEIKRGRILKISCDDVIEIGGQFLIVTSQNRYPPSAGLARMSDSAAAAIEAAKSSGGKENFSQVYTISQVKTRSKLPPGSLGWNARWLLMRLSAHTSVRTKVLLAALIVLVTFYSTDFAKSGNAGLVMHDVLSERVASLR